MKLQGISQNDLSEIIGDSQQAISDFLIKEGNPQRKTREKYFNKLSGFKNFYFEKASNLQVNKDTTGNSSIVHNPPDYMSDLKKIRSLENQNELKVHFDKLLKKVNKTIEQLERGAEDIGKFKELNE